MTLLVASLAATAGCQSARRKVGGDIVRHINFDVGCPRVGYCDTPDSLLQVQMEQPASPFMILTPPFSLVSTPEAWKAGALDRDAFRLEVWFAHEGWFDARFEGWEVHRVREQVAYRFSGRRFLGVLGEKHSAGDPKKAGVVDIRGHIDKGPASTVRSLSILGFDKHVKTVVNSVKSEIGLREGDQYSLEVATLARDTLQQKLQERGFAYASALLHSEAHPDDQAVDVTMVIDMGSGKTVSFGDVEFVGVKDTPLYKLENLVRFETGERYSLSRLDLTRKQLFNTGAFSVVDVVPDLSVRGAPDVPVRIKLTETQFRTLRFGGGFDYDGFRATPRLASSFKHVNMLKRLVRLDLKGSIGYSAIATEVVSRKFDATNVLFDGRVGVTWPQLIAKNIDISTVLSYDRDLQNGQFLYTNPQVDLGAVWRMTEFGSFTLGPHWALYTMPQLDPAEGTTEQAVSGQALLGRDFDGRFQLTSLDARVKWDWRNDPIDTTNGSYWDLSVRQAVPLGAKDDFFYTDITAETRGYLRMNWPLVGKFTGVSRLQGRVLKSWNDSGLPYQERVFMGGLQDIRGFRDGFVGPYDQLCLYSPSPQGDAFSGLQRAGKEATRRYLPRGGVAGVTGTIEARKKLLPAYGVGGSMFADAGVLGFEGDSGQPMLFPVSVGAGLSYDSLVGPIRIDFALRPLAANDQAPVDYVNCANADQQARPYGLFTTSDRSPAYPDKVRQPVIQILFTLSQI